MQFFKTKIVYIRVTRYNYVMAERNVQNLRVIETSQETRENEVSEQVRLSRQTNPIVRKLLKFGTSESTHRFSVKDLFVR